VKNQDFMGKTNYFWSTLPFSPWAVSATWLHVGAPQKIRHGLIRVGIERAWSSRKACEICSSLGQKKKLKKNYFSSHKLPK
jgi:hypothetical protein